MNRTLILLAILAATSVSAQTTSSTSSSVSSSMPLLQVQLLFQARQTHSQSTPEVTHSRTQHKTFKIAHSQHKTFKIAHTQHESNNLLLRIMGP